LKLGIIYMANSELGGQGVGWLTDMVGDLVMETAGPPGPELERPTFDTGRPVPRDDARIRRLAGTYGNNVAVLVRDGALGITVGKDFYPLSLYEDVGEIAGLFGTYSELRVKPPLLDRPGTLVHLNRLAGTVSYYDFHKPDKPDDAPGPDRGDWKPYLGTYRTLMWGRAFGFIATVGVDNGYLTLNGMRCHEHRPGLFFTFDGEALDFRGTIATFRNIPLIRTKR